MPTNKGFCWPRWGGWSGGCFNHLQSSGSGGAAHLICKPSTSRIREFAPCCIKAAESLTGVRSFEDLVRFVAIDFAHMLHPRPGLSVALIWCRTFGSFPTTAKDGVAPREQAFLQDCMHAPIAIGSVRSRSGRSSFRPGNDRRQCSAGASHGTGCNEHSEGPAQFCAGK
jgi:hypothetical protein